MNPLWPIQENSIRLISDAIDNGTKSILLTSPTGTGKSRVVCEVIETLVERGWRAVIYTSRRLLIEQLISVLNKHGIDHGVRAAGHEEDGKEFQVQISSLPTENQRTIKRGQWQIHGTGYRCLVVVDEAHINKGPTAQAMFAKHAEVSHVRLGITATPLDLGGLYDELLIAGSVSDGRACGALVMADHYGPDEPDMRKIKGVTEGEDLTEKQQVKAMMTPTLWGRISKWFDILNPDRRATLCFAPGVRESLWIAEKFSAAGIPAAHIDGANVWVDGEMHETNPDVRAQVLADSKSGRIVVITNRFVMREGVDAPWISHGIFATIFGSLSTYLQSGGRLLRASSGKNNATIQDHGGNWWRHGSLNEDREWFLEQTGTMAYGLRADRLRAKKEAEPRRCPVCSRISRGRRCVCGFLFAVKQSRPVVTSDGELVLMNGDIFRPRSICQSANGPKLWEKMYYRSMTEKGQRTFKAAAALFAYENQWQWPDPQWPLMPTNPLDWYQQVNDVPRNRLT